MPGSGKGGGVDAQLGSRRMEGEGGWRWEHAAWSKAEQRGGGDLGGTPAHSVVGAPSRRQVPASHPIEQCGLEGTLKSIFH